MSNPKPAHTGDVIAALASFFIPGLGQLVQGRLLASLFFFVFTFLLWFLLLGWIFHLAAPLDCIRYGKKNH